MAKITVDIPRDEDDFFRYGAIAAGVFGFAPERAQIVFDSVGRENVRVVRVNGEIAGGMLVIPMGQFFGGRSVPMLGIALVAVAPESRASGAASTMMRAGLKEYRTRNGAISTLYPATQPVYRRAGYEQAGVHFTYSLPTAGLDVRERGLELRPVQPEDDAALRSLYLKWAANHPGNLARNDYMWRRVYELRGEKAQGFVVARGGEIEGYLFYFQRTAPAPAGLNLPGYTMHLTDFVATTPTSARHLLTFLADHRSLVNTVYWNGGPNEPVLGLLGELTATVTLRWNWMLRVVHLEQALMARGYGPGLSAELHLNVRDDVLAENEGRWVVRVRDGAATVERGGQGTLEIDVRGLASLYSGYATPAALVAQGYLTGPSAELLAAGSVFAGPFPWLRDQF